MSLCLELRRGRGSERERQGTPGPGNWILPVVKPGAALPAEPRGVMGLPSRHQMNVGAKKVAGSGRLGSHPLNTPRPQAQQDSRVAELPHCRGGEGWESQDVDSHRDGPQMRGPLRFHGRHVLMESEGSGRTPVVPKSQPSRTGAQGRGEFFPGKHVDGDLCMSKLWSGRSELTEEGALAPQKGT